MKKVYTDYMKFNKPITAYFLHWEGRIEKVKIIDCDFNKYVTFLYGDGTEEHYKWGYVFETYDIAQQALDAYNYVNSNEEKDNVWDYYINKYPDCINPYKLLMSNKNYARFNKFKRKQEKMMTQWYVAIDDGSYYTSTKFKTMREALMYFGKLDDSVIEYACMGEQNTNLTLITFEDNQLWLEDNDKYNLKSRHIGKESTYKEWRKRK